MDVLAQADHDHHGVAIVQIEDLDGVVASARQALRCIEHHEVLQCQILDLAHVLQDREDERVRCRDLVRVQVHFLLVFKDDLLGILGVQGVVFYA